MIWVRNFNPEIHHRRSIRLQGYDYSRPGYYFITLCCSFRECLFGEIKDNEMVLNNFGRIAHNEWIQSARIRFEIELDVFVIMPNHFHAIVKICDNSDRGDRLDDDGRGDRPVAPMMVGATGRSPLRDRRGPNPKSIGSLMAGYKSSVTKRINQLRRKPGEHVWQRDYFEHIIRDEKSLFKIRQYILDNPRNWHKDELYL